MVPEETNHNNHNNDSIHNSEEEKEEKQEEENKIPLAVPLVADTNQEKSITRNDAKQITQTRLKRLKQLSSFSEKSLSRDEKDEKKRIIRLEKNRRAAAVSRRKKKMYVKNLEEKTQLMAKHLAILEMENAHLRALLNAAQQQQQIIPPPLSHFTQIPTISSSCSSSSKNSENNSATITIENSMEPTIDFNEPCTKKRRLNNGSSMSNNNISCDTSVSDISILEPLPLPIPSTAHGNGNAVPPPPPPASSSSIGHRHAMAMGMTFGRCPPHLLTPNLAKIHPSRLIPYHPSMSHHHHAAHLMRGPPQRQINNVDKIEAIVLDKDDDEQDDADDADDIPPSVVVPRLSDEFINILDNEIISQGIDKCGSVVAFEQK